MCGHGPARYLGEAINQLITDGSCPVQGDIGGYCALIRRGEDIEIAACGHEEESTNNRVEMIAVIEGLRAVHDYAIEVISDSQYITEGASKWLPKWKEAGIVHTKSNPDLWEELDEILQQREVVFTWVRGHNGHVDNTLADRLAYGEVLQVIRQRYLPKEPCD